MRSRIAQVEGGYENVVVAEFHRYHFDSFAGDNNLVIGQYTVNQHIEMTRRFITKQFTRYCRNLRKDLIDLGYMNTV